MEFQINNELFTRNVEISEAESGFKVRARGCVLRFRKVFEHQYDIYEGKERSASFRWHGSHILVTTSSGEPIMHIDKTGTEDIPEEELCRIVGEMVAHWNEK